MPSNSTGKWVQRAATTGGGRTYRGQMPVNWYASLVVICVVGLLLVVLPLRQSPLNYGDLSAFQQPLLAPQEAKS